MLKIGNFVFNKKLISYIYLFKNNFTGMYYISVKLTTGEEFDISFDSQKERAEEFDRLLEKVEEK